MDGHNKKAMMHLDLMQVYLEQFKLFMKGKSSLEEKADNALKELSDDYDLLKKINKKG